MARNASKLTQGSKDPKWFPFQSGSEDDGRMTSTSVRGKGNGILARSVEVEKILEDI